MAAKRKGSAFAEMLSIFIHQDYRFPILEVFAFLFAGSVLLVGSMSVNNGYNAAAFGYMTGISGLSLTLLVFMILIWKNIAFGLGGDFEKGVMQTFLTYPLSRGRILLARLLSSVGVALAVLTSAQFLVIFVMAPLFAESQIATLALGFVTSLGTPLLLTAVVLLVAVVSKQGGLSLLVGIVLYFALSILLLVLLGIGYQEQNYILVSSVFLLNPVSAFQLYYNPQNVPSFSGPSGSTVWTPNFGEAAGFLAANMILTLAILAVSVFIFTRRLET